MFIFRFLTQHKKASIIIAAVVVLLIAPVALLMRPAQPVYVTAVAERGDIVQTVEAVGTVTSERDLELKFPLTGILQSVRVKEGDRVQAGQTLAQLRSGNLGAAVAMQAANLQSAQAQLQALQEGTRPEDIAIAEAQVANKRASLQVAQASLQSAKQNLEQAQDQLKTLQQEVDTTLGGQVETSRNTVSTQLVVAETALSSVQDVLGTTVVQDAIIKAQPGGDTAIQSQRQSAMTDIVRVRSDLSGMQSYKDALRVLMEAQTAVSRASGAVDQLFSLIMSLPETAYFTNALREQYKTTLSTQRSLAQGALSSLATAYANLQSASASYDTKIGSAQASITTNEGAKQRAEADILTYQTALQAQEADLASKKAPARRTDLDAAVARVRQAAASLAQAQANYQDTVLYTPVDGVVTHVNVKAGEATPATGPAITVLGNTPFRVEMYVSEVDVPKLQHTQSGSIELDAFPGVQYKLRVSEIDASPTLVENVSKYRVKLDFLYPHDELKIGMTGDVTIVTGERVNVVKIPARAVIEKDGTKAVRIMGKNGTVTEVTVTTGMEGQDSEIEILSGLQGSEKIVVLQK